MGKHMLPRRFVTTVTQIHVIPAGMTAKALLIAETGLVVQGWEKPVALAQNAHLAAVMEKLMPEPLSIRNGMKNVTELIFEVEPAG